MRKSLKLQKGEIATVITIAGLIILGVSTLVSSAFLSKNNQTTTTKAASACESGKLSPGTSVGKIGNTEYFCCGPYTGAVSTNCPGYWHNSTDSSCTTCSGSASNITTTPQIMSHHCCNIKGCGAYGCPKSKIYVNVYDYTSASGCKQQGGTWDDCPSGLSYTAEGCYADSSCTDNGSPYPTANPSTGKYKCCLVSACGSGTGGCKTKDGEKESYVTFAGNYASPCSDDVVDGKTLSYCDDYNGLSNGDGCYSCQGTNAPAATKAPIATNTPTEAAQASCEFDSPIKCSKFGSYTNADTLINEKIDPNTRSAEFYPASDTACLGNNHSSDITKFCGQEISPSPTLTPTLTPTPTLQTILPPGITTYPTGGSGTCYPAKTIGFNGIANVFLDDPDYGGRAVSCGGIFIGTTSDGKGQAYRNCPTSGTACTYRCVYNGSENLCTGSYVSSEMFTYFFSVYNHSSDIITLQKISLYDIDPAQQKDTNVTKDLSMQLQPGQAQAFVFSKSDICSALGLFHDPFIMANVQYLKSGDPSEILSVNSTGNDDCRGGFNISVIIN